MIYRPGERWQRPAGDMRVLVGTERMLAVSFDAGRRTADRGPASRATRSCGRLT